MLEASLCPLTAWVFVCVCTVEFSVRESMFQWMELKSSLLGSSGGSNTCWELRVDIGESLELVLVQVLNHLLVRGGQHRRVACEKAVKVLSLPSALSRRVREGMVWEEEKWGWTGMDGAGEGRRRGKTKEKGMEPRCEVISLGNGFKYQNKQSDCGALDFMLPAGDNNLSTPHFCFPFLNI